MTAPPDGSGSVSISITPESAEVIAGVGAQTYTATVRDADGREVPGAVISWAATAQAALSVRQGPTTIATGVAGGLATITASSGTASANATLTVTLPTAPTLAQNSVVVPMNATLAQPSPGLLANAQLGVPAGSLQSFGGGALGGSVVSFAAGQTAPLRASDHAPGPHGAVTVNADGSFSIVPPPGFEGTFSFQFRVSNAAGSADGTVNVAVDGPPTVAVTSPVDGATQVSAATSIAITFSEPVTPLPSAFLLQCSGTSRAFSLSGWGTKVLVLTPSVDLPYGSSCEVTVKGERILDADSHDGPDAMPADYSFGFTVSTGTLPVARGDQFAAPTSPLIVSAPGVLENDGLGTPGAVIVSFGGGSLGGAITAHAPGASVPLPGGGSVRLDQDGSLTLHHDGTIGGFTFSYRLQNAAGTSDATVTILVQEPLPPDSPPSVAFTIPADGATGVAPGASITIGFNEPVTVGNGAFRLECPAGFSNSRPFSVSGDGETFVLTPASAMPLNATCRVRVDAADVRDVDQVDPPDRPLDDFDFSFRIGAAPAPADDSYQTGVNTTLVVAAPGVSAGDDLGVPAALVSSFGGGSLGGSVMSNAAGSVVPFGAGGSVDLDPDGGLVVIPPLGFTGTITFQYRLTNGSGVGDATVTVVVDDAPSVVSTTPADGATAVDVGSSIEIAFSESVTAAPGAFTIECPAPGSLQTHTVAGSGTGTLLLTPAGPLPQGVTCTVTVIAALVRDTDANDPPDQLAANHVFQFTTLLEPSAVDDSYQTFANTPLVEADPGVLSNDQLGAPVGSLVSFGGGSLGGSVTDHAPGFPAAVGGSGSVTMNADGSFSVTPPTDFLGTITFLYRLSNGAASSDGQVTVQVEDAPPAVLSTFPANGATNVPANTTLVATFTEPVFVAQPPTFNCTISGILTIADFNASGGPVSYTLDPIVDFAPGETCTGVILASEVTDLDSDDPPDNMVEDFEFSFTIAPAEVGGVDVASSLASPIFTDLPSRRPLGDGLNATYPPDVFEMTQAIPLTARATVPDHVLIQEVEGQSAILHMEANRYFGLDDVGTQIWRTVTTSGSVGEAIESLAAVYEVEHETLERDVLSLLARLSELGLLEMQ